jgi:hypothetical protein
MTCMRGVQEARLVLEEETPDAAMMQGVQLWLNEHFFGKDASYTEKGMWWAADWGTLRNAALMAHTALRAANILDKRSDDNGEVVNVSFAPPCSAALCSLTCMHDAPCGPAGGVGAPCSLMRMHDAPCGPAGGVGALRAVLCAAADELHHGKHRALVRH